MDLPASTVKVLFPGVHVSTTGVGVGVVTGAGVGVASTRSLLPEQATSAAVATATRQLLPTKPNRALQKRVINFYSTTLQPTGQTLHSLLSTRLRYGCAYGQNKCGGFWQGCCACVTGIQPEFRHNLLCHPLF
jgi:hypothetical protein